MKEAIQALNAVVEAFSPAYKCLQNPKIIYHVLSATGVAFQLITNGDRSVTIENEGTPVYFVPQDNNTFALYNGEEYVNYKGGDTWTLNALSDAYGWAIVAIDGGYTLTGKNDLLSTGNNRVADGDHPVAECFGNKQTTNGNYIWTFTELEEITASVTEAGWATLYTTVALDFSNVEGLNAYTAKVDEVKAIVTLTKVDNVPANTGVVLEGTGKHTIPVITNATTEEKGDLVGSTTDTECTADGIYYILTANDENEVQFNPATSGTIAAGRAYLVIDDENVASKLRVVIAGEATAISGVDADKAENGATYNVAGQLVNDNYKGIVIKNGKKYVQK